MSWSGLQRETLEAMGFSVLLPRTPAGVVEPAAEAALDTASREIAPREAAPRESAMPRRAPERSTAATASLPAAAVPAQAEPRPALPAQDRLARALLRAAGRAPDAVDAPILLAQWPDPARLRRDPAAKRALWPRLRALRRADA